jgi:hypothetical protein
MYVIACGVDPKSCGDSICIGWWPCGCDIEEDNIECYPPIKIRL